MYNGNTVIEREIKEKYNEIFKIIGEKVGLSKLTYETYMGLRDGDTRKNKFRSILEDELKNRKSADISACIDTINKDVKREDRLDDKIDSFFKLGEKIYPKEKEQEEVTTPTPDRLFEVNDEEEQEIEQEEVEKEEIEDEEIEEEKKDKLKEKIDVKKEIVKALKRAGIVIVGALDFISLTLLAGAITTGILSGGLTFGTVALFAALPAATLAVIYRNIRKNKKKELAKKKKEEKNSKVETKEEEKEEEKTKIKTEEAGLDFGKDLDSPAKLDFGEDMEGDKQLEAETISDPVSSSEIDTTEELAKEMPAVETELSDPIEEHDTEEPLTEPEYEEDIENPSARESEEGIIMPEETAAETEEERANKVPSDRRQKTIYDAEQTIVEINKKIEGYEQKINKANQRMKEIQDNEYGYPNQYHVDARHVTKPKREYNELKNQKVEALKEMKKYQDIVHDLSERIDKIRGTEVPPVTEEVTKHQVPINNWDTKDIYIVNGPGSRIKESVDYTDKFEDSRKK